MEITNPRRFAVFCVSVLLMVSVFGGVGYWVSRPVQEEPTIASSQSPVPSVTPDQLTIFLTAQNKQGETIHLTCQANNCQPVNIGTVYQYQAQTTALVRPRDLMISPNERYVAYWLDNIAEPSKHLTELWVYDAQEKSTHVLAEHIFMPDVRGAVRWNGSSTSLWFVGNTADAGKAEKIELIIIAIAPPGQSAQSMPSSDIVDISPDGKRVAVRSDIANSRGNLAFSRWLDDQTLLYATEDTTGYNFWRQVGSTPTLAGRFNFSKLPTGLTQIHIRLIEPDFSAHTQNAVSQQLDDGQLIAFVEEHVPEIVQDHPTARAVRILTTDQDNAIFVDYLATGNVTKRILLTIHDALHPEWSILARYESVGGEWHKVAGGSGADPAPKRIYEWEEGVKQWILKQELDK